MHSGNTGSRDREKEVPLENEKGEHAKVYHQM